jgi:ATP-dependent Clp protease ATP-binding subunit ClpA
VFERFTPQARHVLVLAQEAARDLDHSFLGTEHLLLGVIDETGGTGARVLDARGVSRDAVAEEVLQRTGRGDPGSAAVRPPFTPRAKKALELSLREALRLDHSYIGTEHLLLGLIREGHGVAAQILVELGADLEGLRSDVQAFGESPGGGVVPRKTSARRVWSRGTRTVSARMSPELEPPEGAVKISYGRFSQTITDPELVASLSRASAEDLHAALRMAVVGDRQDPRPEQNEAEDDEELPGEGPEQP